MTTIQSDQGTADKAPPPRILVWDLPTRVFHWLLVVSFLGAYVLSEGERWRGLHALLGYTAGGLILFRLSWGVLGTRYARFSGFAWSPRAVRDYLVSLFMRKPRHYVGHNPAGSWAVLALLVLVAATAASGWAVLSEVGPRWMEDVHEAIANATLALAGVHVAAVIVSSVLHRENLVRAMVSGFKRARDAVPAAGPRTAVAVMLLAAVVAFWGGWIPAPGLERGTGLAGLSVATTATPASTKRDGERDRGRNRGRSKEHRGERDG
jgi:cytochrome b